MKKTVYIFLLFFFLGFESNNIIAQDWKNWIKITPLISSCEDVKRIFSIEKCEYPDTFQRTSNYWLHVEFSKQDYNKTCDLNDQFKNLSKGIVLSISLTNIGISLKDFESNLSEYEIEQEEELPDNFIYRNKKRGIELLVSSLDDTANTLYIRNITLRPSLENVSKFKCCRFPITRNWEKIVPLVSTCEDVKRMFKIDKCEYPYTKFDNSEWRTLQLSEKNHPEKCDVNSEYRNIPMGTVLSVSVSNIAILLKDFESDFSGYEIEQNPDLPHQFIYKNKKEGIELFVINIEDEENTLVVQDITLRPSAENATRFECSLQWKEIKPFVSNCNDLKRIFKIDKCTFPATAIKTSRFNLTVNFPPNICNKKCNPKTNCWKVSKDTVLSMVIEPTYLSETMRVADFGSEWGFTKKRNPDSLDLLKYTDADLGIVLDAKVEGNTVIKIYFFPSITDETKYKCQKAHK